MVRLFSFQRIQITYMCCWVGFRRQRRWRQSRSLWRKPRETSGTQASRPSPDRNRHRALRPHHHGHSSKLQLKESPKSDSRAILRRPIAIIAFPLNNIALIRNDARVDIAFEVAEQWNAVTISRATTHFRPLIWPFLQSFSYFSNICNGLDFYSKP